MKHPKSIPLIRSSSPCVHLFACALIPSSLRCVALHPFMQFIPSVQNPKHPITRPRGVEAANDKELTLFWLACQADLFHDGGSDGLVEMSCGVGGGSARDCACAGEYGPDELLRFEFQYPLMVLRAKTFASRGLLPRHSPQRQCRLPQTGNTLRCVTWRDDSRLGEIIHEQSRTI